MGLLRERMSDPKEVSMQVRSSFSPAPTESPSGLRPGGPCARRAGFRRCLALASISFLAACGGGGGTAGALPTLSAGAFHSITFKGFHGPPDHVRTNVGVLLSDGVSLLTDAGSIENDDGVIGTDPGGPVVPYSLSADGVLSLHDGFGTDHFQGGVAAGGKTFGLAAVLPIFPSEVVLTLGVKKDAGLSNATLTGDYHSCYFGRAAGAHAGVVGMATFDGSGGVGLGTTLANTDGVITGPSFGLGAYDVAADGTFALGPPYRGGASADGEHAIVGGGVTPGSLPLTWVFVRQATAASLASLTGTYTIVGIGYDLAEGKYADVAGSVRIDGDGRCMVSVTINREGRLSSLFWASTYTVAADGTLEMTLGAGGDTYRGGISADGSFGVLGGGSNPGSDPALFVLFRR